MDPDAIWGGEWGPSRDGCIKCVPSYVSGDKQKVHSNAVVERYKENCGLCLDTELRIHVLLMLLLHTAHVTNAAGDNPSQYRAITKKVMHVVRQRYWNQVRCIDRYKQRQMLVTCAQ